MPTDFHSEDELRALLADPATTSDSSELAAFLQASPQLILEELVLTRRSYEGWRDEGQRLHGALLEIWRGVEEDTKHMTFGDDPQTVVSAVWAELKRRSESAQPQS